ncbi:Mur ligase family protein [Pukyongiella litopenaei]|uniref:Mur ligase n=1 Tax=Pukyongiella litopenaei TaxID=2605946 RepID=A0A2S0MLC5_9RHOB|nr:Mur ligase family protein [Pukyongiella litopenaei]AVO36688.1 Mur ligase [Pukyongiella litopenaei]
MEPVEIIEEALDVPIPDAPALRLDDARRLTGPGLLWSRAGAVLDVLHDGSIDPDRIVALWDKQARRVLDALGWQDETLTHRRYDGGVSLALSAPMDQLYSAIFAAQTAWHFCAADLLDREPGDFAAMVDDVRGVMAREANPPLPALIAAAADHGIDILCDDDDISIGQGTGSRTWPVHDLPAPGDVDWAALHDVPVAMITGTNGKTTTTRLCAAIATAAGRVAGLTSTEFVMVGGDILDRGDYSGPGGARLLLRDRRLETGFLEVARGGILRRGLPTRHVRAALVTNVAADHLGQYGVNTVPELAQAKFAVHRALAPGGVLVLNADDPHVVDEAARTRATTWWFALSPDAAKIGAARAAGTPCAWADTGNLWFFDGTTAHDIMPVADIPIAMGGAARHNIANALGALCLSRALGIGDEAIRAGMARFRPDASDNPGRCNEFAVNGARVFVDFAHNPHSIAAMADTMAAIPAKRRFAMLSHAGDRSDGDIRDLTMGVLALDPDMVVAAEIEDYLRGRSPGELPALIRRTCLDAGMAADAVLTAGSPRDGAERILDMVGPGDLALLLVLSDRARVFELLEQRGIAV